MAPQYETAAHTEPRTCNMSMNLETAVKSCMIWNADREVSVDGVRPRTRNRVCQCKTGFDPTAHRLIGNNGPTTNEATQGHCEELMRMSSRLVWTTSDWLVVTTTTRRLGYHEHRLQRCSSLVPSFDTQKKTLAGIFRDPRTRHASILKVRRGLARRFSDLPISMEEMHSSTRCRLPSCGSHASSLTLHLIHCHEHRT